MKKTPAYLILAATGIFLGTGCDKIKDLAGEIAKKQAAPVAAAKPASDWIRDLSMAEFKTFVTQPGVLAIIDYHAEWCGPCKQLSPILEKLVMEKKGTVLLGRVDIDQAGAMAATQRVTSIPDVRFYRDGEIVDRFSGLIPEAEIREKIDKHSKDLKPSEPAIPVAEPPPAKPAEPSIQPMHKDWRPPGIERR